MAILSVPNLSKNNNRLLQIVLISAGLISTMLIVKGVVNFPYSCELIFSSLTDFKNSIRCFLSSPLYICIIINSIVVLIAVSSTFHRNDETASVNIDNLDSQTLKSLDSFPSPPAPAPPPPQTLYFTEELVVRAAPKILRDTTKFESVSEVSLEELLSDEIKIKKVNKNPSSQNIPVDNNHNEEEDTIEATWKSITGGTEKKKNKELEKSETWELPPVQHLESKVLVSSTTVRWKELRKSETFNDAVSIRRNGGLRRDPSTSLDEFNNQVETFIKNFNDNMRLQRQESDQKFFEMINSH